jgi:2,4-didehydro-3-deoxy-L-rhamnonate hydrolase
MGCDMKICRFNEDRIGIVDGEEVRDITDLAREIGIRPPERPLGDALIIALPKIAEELADSSRRFPHLPLAKVRLLSPVFLPTKIMGAGANYRAHRAEMESDPSTTHPKLPDTLSEMGLLLKASTSIVGPSQAIELRFPELRTDHEIELVAVIGRTTSQINHEAALGCVAGYCLGVDVSLRGSQFRSLRKSIDTYTVVGPWLVTADEIPDPGNLRLTLRVNGSVRQDTSTSDMINDVATLIEYASSHYTLYPGDMIFTGTPSGVARIHAGDVLQLHGEKIGSFEIQVRAFS